MDEQKILAEQMRQAEKAAEAIEGVVGGNEPPLMKLLFRVAAALILTASLALLFIIFTFSNTSLTQWPVYLLAINALVNLGGFWLFKRWSVLPILATLAMICLIFSSTSSLVGAIITIVFILYFLFVLFLFLKYKEEMNGNYFNVYADVPITIVILWLLYTLLSKALG